jgi:protein CpxP
MYKKILGIATVTAALVLGQTAMAESRCVGGGIKRVVESLNLDKTQKEKIKSILEEMKTGMTERSTQLDTINNEINEQVKSDTTDQSKLDSLVDKKAGLIGDMIKAKLNATRAISLVLTAKQKTELQTRLQRIEDKIASQFKDCE